MAHLDKFKASAVWPMVWHYERRWEKLGRAGRENIDPERVGLDYTVGNVPEAGLGRAVMDAVERAKAVRGRGRGYRKDSVVMADWVITAPTDLREEDEPKFFEAMYETLRDYYGDGRVLCGYVHVDERHREPDRSEQGWHWERSRDHMHLPVIPVEPADGHFMGKRLFTRKSLKAMHPLLQAAADEALGYHVSVTLGEDQAGEKQLNSLSQPEFKAAKDTKKRLDMQIEDLTAQSEEMSLRAAESAQKAAKAEIAARRALEAQRAAETAQRAAEARQEDAERKAAEAETRLESVQRQEREAEAECRSLVEQVRACIDRFREFGARLVARVSDLLRAGYMQPAEASGYLVLAGARTRQQRTAARRARFAAENVQMTRKKAQQRGVAHGNAEVGVPGRNGIRPVHEHELRPEPRRGHGR